jgi:hypothetical protein
VVDGADRPVFINETAEFVGHGRALFRARDDRARNLAEAGSNLNRTKGQPTGRANPYSLTAGGGPNRRLILLSSWSRTSR